MDLQPWFRKDVELCSKCQGMVVDETGDLDFDGKPHHPDRDSLMTSVYQCQFCIKLWSAVDSLPWREDFSMEASTAYRLYHGHSGGYVLKLIMKSGGDYPLLSFYGEVSLFPKADIELLEEGKKSTEGPSEENELAHFDDEMVHRWLRRCDDEHENCAAPPQLDDISLPTRLVDVGDKDSSTWKLVVTKDTGLSAPLKYATVTHVPEASQQLVLTHKTQGRMEAGCEDTEVDQQFKVAIRIARRLGIRYVWIDALCVIQDSPADKAAEAPKICDVFLYSALNLAATPSDNYGDNSGQTACYVDLVEAPWNGPTQQYIVLDDQYWAKNISELPLMKRPENYERHLLASRILYFGHFSDVLFYECRTCRSSQVLPDKIPGPQPSELGILRFLFPIFLKRGRKLEESPGDDGGDAKGESKEENPEDPEAPQEDDGESALGIAVWQEFWSTVITEYTDAIEKYSSPPTEHPFISMHTLSIDEPEEPTPPPAAPANPLVHLAGLAKLITLRTGEPYSAGIWAFQLPGVLLWSTNPNYRQPATARVERKLPTWSWARNTSRTELEHPLITDFDFPLLALKPEGTKPDDPLFKTVTPTALDGMSLGDSKTELWIKGKVFTCVVLSEDDGWVEGIKSIDGKELGEEERYTLRLDATPESSGSREVGLLPLVFAMVYGYMPTSFCLLVEKVEDAENQAAEEKRTAYARIGHVALQSELAKKIALEYGIEYSEDGETKFDEAKFKAMDTIKLI